MVLGDVPLYLRPDAIQHSETQHRAETTHTSSLGSSSPQTAPSVRSYTEHENKNIIIKSGGGLLLSRKENAEYKTVGFHFS